jgi:hypothetical protein
MTLAAAEPRRSALLFLSTTHRATPAAVALTATTCAVAVKVPAAAALTDGEVRFLAIRALPFGTRQGGANQWSMHRTIVFARIFLASLHLV